MASCSVLGPRLGWVWASLESSLVVVLVEVERHLELRPLHNCP